MHALNFFVNFICYAVIVALAAYDGYTYWTRGGRDHVSLKGEMTGMGILGTFVGIYLGLIDFNVVDISGSIPALLEGLKTAFGTSIVGLFCATSLTVAQAVKPVAFRKTGDPIADTLVRVFQEFEPLMGELRDATKKNTGEIIAMRRSMEKTMDDLSKGVTTEIVKALEGVISDFNTNLKEQFGENFKQLNEACFKLVEWQENHIPTVESATKALDGVKQAFETLRIQTGAMIAAHNELLSALQRVGEDTRGLAAATKNLAATTEELEATLARADRLVDSVKEKIEATGNVFNHTMDGFDRKTREVADATHNRSERLITLVRENMDQAGKAFGLSLSGIEQKVTDVTTRISEDLEDLPRIGDAVESAAAGSAKAAAAAAGAAQSAAEANATAAKAVVLTRGEMERAHRNLEQALVALTNGFSHAYREYLDGLRKLTDQ